MSAVAFRSAQSVINATAGTSVTVSRPASIVDTGDNPGRDHLIAFVACTGAPTVTAPAGWTLVTSTVDAGNNVTLKSYRKLADGEGANWTWTLGSSQRNWGWVGAYTGVDPDNPIADPFSGFDTDLTLTSSTILDPFGRPVQNGAAVSATAATRTASGSATTWAAAAANDYFEPAISERLDTSTNAGSGTDITGEVIDFLSTLTFTSTVELTHTASQSQTAGVAQCIGLRPYFTPYGGEVGDIGIVVEAAFDADPDGATADMSWTDVSPKVLEVAGVEITAGRPNARSTATPTQVVFTLKNLDGEWTHPNGTYYGKLIRGLPFRVRLTGFGLSDHHRATAFLSSARLRWDASARMSVVDVVAHGRLHRLQQGERLRSAGYRAIVAAGPIDYWPTEDGEDTVNAANAIPGGTTGPSEMTFASDSSFVGSDPLAVVTAASRVRGRVRAHTATGQWTGLCVMNMPSEPAANTVLFSMSCSGTARRWDLWWLPSTNDLTLRAYDSDGAQILTTSVTMTPADVFGHPMALSLTVTQDGSDVDYAAWIADPTTATGITGTLASRTIGRIKQLDVPVSTGTTGTTYGHFAALADPDIDASGGPPIIQAVLHGHSGDWTWERFARLCVEESIPFTTSVGAVLEPTMGPQGSLSLYDLLRECEVAEGNLLSDVGVDAGETGVLWFPARDERDNADTVLTLDVSSDHLSPDFEPTLDNIELRNDVEVSRPNGSTARFIDQTSIDREGRYAESVSVNVDSDDFLLDLAGYRVALGTAEGMRYPVAGINLRRSPALAEDWLACTLNSRVDITNPPSQYPPDTIETFLEGYTERISQTEWTAKLNLSPAAPFRIGLLAEDDPADDTEYVGHLDADEMELLIAVDTDDTTWRPNCVPDSITTALHPDSFPVLLRVSGEDVSLTAASATTPSFVAAGVVDHDDNAALTPALPAGLAEGDLLLIFAAIRNSGAGIPVTPSGFTRIDAFGASANVAVFAKYASSSESTPTVTFADGVSGATTSAQCAAFRDVSMVVRESVAQLNGSAQNIAYPAATVTYDNCLGLYLGWKADDWTSVAQISGALEIGEPDSTTGDDQGIVWDYVLQSTAADIASGSFSVTGGASAISRGGVIVLQGMTRSWTVTRSVNTISKSHAAEAEITLHPHDAFQLGV
ncbi:MAG TPA: hypothetical protein VF174_15885 [Micromonosporaceae bacterium]